MEPTPDQPLDDFERQLARMPRRAAPPEWRADILAKADAAAAARGPERPRSRADAPSSPSNPVLQLWAWLTGISPAWRALAAVWAACLAVNHFIAEAPTGLLASGGDRGSLAPEQIAAARAQRAELLQLAGLSEPRSPDPQPARPPGPRSALRRPERPSFG